MIKSSLSSTSALDHDGEDEEDGISDADDDDVSTWVDKLHPNLTCQAALHHQSGPSPYVEYNAILSPSYRVPVLYFSFQNLPNQTASGVKTAHDLLVPEHLRAMIRDTGVMGGISMSVGQAHGKKKSGAQN